MIILGIDPGFEKLGCAILKKSPGRDELIYSICLVSNRKLLHEERLFALGKELEKIMNKYQPDILAIEKLFFTKNQKTAIRVAEAHGMILFLAASKKIPVKEFTPLEIKIALTGYGKADKRQIQEMARMILKLKKIPRSDDEVDAIACAITCSSHLSTAII